MPKRKRTQLGRMVVVEQKRFSGRVTKPTLQILILNWRLFGHQRASPGINSVGFDILFG